MYIVGIDPGIKGYIAIVKEEKCLVTRDLSDFELIKMPIENFGGRNIVDTRKLREILTIGAAKVVIEEPHFVGKQSAQSLMTSCTNFGRILAVLDILGHAYKTVRASEWQLAVQKACAGYTDPPVYRKKDPAKKVSLRAAQCIFSGEDDLFAEKVHDGLVDAILLARYCGWISN